MGNNQTPNGSTVFIIDDDEAVRDSLQWLVESENIQACSFSSCQDFLTRYQPEQRGCLLLDVRMPDMSGLELQANLEKKSVQLPIIFISGHADVPMAVRALKAGAFDFFEKPFDDQKLINRMRDAIEADQNNHAEQAECREIMQRLALLTKREKEVLNLVVAGTPNKVIGGELGVSLKTVEAHRSRVMDKLKAKSLSQLVRMTLLAHQGRPQV